MPSCSVHRRQLITLQGCVHGGHGRVYALRRICGREVHHVLGCWTHESTLISCGSMRASSAVALQQSLSDFLSRIACRYEEGAELKLTISFSGFRGGHCREKEVSTACRERSLQSFPLWESQRNLGLWMCTNMTKRRHLFVTHGGRSDAWKRAGVQCMVQV